MGEGEGLHRIRSVVMPKSPPPPGQPESMSAKVAALREELGRYDAAMSQQRAYDTPTPAPKAIPAPTKPPFAMSPITTAEPSGPVFNSDDRQDRKLNKPVPVARKLRDPRDDEESIRSVSLADSWDRFTELDASPVRPVPLSTQGMQAYPAYSSRSASGRSPAASLRHTRTHPHVYDIVAVMHSALSYPYNYQKFMQCIQQLHTQSEWVDIQSTFSECYPDFNNGMLTRTVKMVLAYDEIEEVKHTLKCNGIVFERTSREVEGFGRSRNSKMRSMQRTTNHSITRSPSPVQSSRRYSVAIPRSAVKPTPHTPHTPHKSYEEPRRGSLIRVMGLRSRDDLNGTVGHVLDKRGEKVKVRVGDEEVYLKSENTEVVQSRTIPTEECTANEAAVVIYNALREGPERVIFGVMEDMTPRKWQNTQEVYHVIYGQADLPGTLRDNMTGKGYSRCVSILKRNNIRIDSEHSAARGDEGRRPEKDSHLSPICKQCGHERKMPFCGLTGQRHHHVREMKQPAPTKASGFSGTSKALIISCDYRGKGVVSLRDRREHSTLMKNALGRHVKGRAVVLAENDASNLPTKKNIVKGLRWLTKDVGPADSLFLYFSGHSCESLQGAGLGIIPCDYSQAGSIHSDELCAILCEALPRGSGLTCVMDCPGGADILRMPYEVQSGRGGVPHVIDAHGTPAATTAEVVVVSVDSRDHSPSSVLNAFTSVLRSSTTPTFHALFNILQSNFQDAPSASPVLTLSWPASLRDERLLLGDVTTQ